MAQNPSTTANYNEETNTAYYIDRKTPMKVFKQNNEFKSFSGRRNH
jgi:hypothetical protein